MIRTGGIWGLDKVGSEWGKGELVLEGFGLFGACPTGSASSHPLRDVISREGLGRTHCSVVLSCLLDG